MGTGRESMGSVTNTIGQPRPPSRPRELEDQLNRYLFHPLSGRLAHLLVPTGISPSAVSVFGVFTAWAAAMLYPGALLPQSVPLAVALHLAWHVIGAASVIEPLPWWLPPPTIQVPGSPRKWPVS